MLINRFAVAFITLAAVGPVGAKCDATAGGDADGYLNASNRVATLSEFQSWLAAVKSRPGVKAMFGTHIDKQVRTRGKCYWSVSVYSDEGSHLSLWQTFLVPVDGGVVLKRDSATGEPYIDMHTECLPETEARDPTDARLASARALQGFLKRNPSYRLLALKDTAVHGEFVRSCMLEPSEVEAARRWKEDSFRPIVEADTNRDGMPDLVAVFVSAGKFSVAVFHGARGGFSPKPSWVIRGASDVMLGVHVSDSGAIVPLYCSGCDSNPWYHWIDSNYELFAHLRGEMICIQQGAIAYSSPNLKSKVAGQTDRPTEAQIVRVGPRGTILAKKSKAFRWYLVKSKDNARLAGYVPSHQFLEEPGDCE